ncbi:MAG: hypothetical protein AAFN78_16275 [Pseudomonadota bacterium]
MNLLLLAFAAAAIPETATVADADVAWTASGGFCEPETVLALPDETLLVSNVCNFRERGNGFLTLLDKAGKALEWQAVDGLDAPLGMALVGDRLYVVDNNHVRVLRWPGFEPLEYLPLSTAVANDIAVAADGTMYVTDTAKGQVVVVSPDGEQSVLQASVPLDGANGIALREGELYVGGARLWCVNLENGATTTIGGEWLADIDGIEFEADGTLQVTPVGGPLIRYLSDGDIRVLSGEGISSANHGFAAALGLALIPTGFDNTVIAIRVPLLAGGKP